MFQNRDWPEVDLSMGSPEIRKSRSKSWAHISSIVIELAASHKYVSHIRPTLSMFPT
jgi:hypothetical protein